MISVDLTASSLRNAAFTLAVMVESSMYSPVLSLVGVPAQPTSPRGPANRKGTARVKCEVFMVLFWMSYTCPTLNSQRGRECPRVGANFIPFIAGGFTEVERGVPGALGGPQGPFAAPKHSPTRRGRRVPPHRSVFAFGFDQRFTLERWRS